MTRAKWLVALFIAAGCGASAVQVQRAKTVKYQADFPEVWAAVNSAVKEHYQRIKQEDGVQGVIVTEWTVIEKKADSTKTDNINSSAGAKVGDVNAGDLFQARVRIVEGGPPWQIIVEGEAAEYRPGLASLRPYPRGAIDEPQWVQGRIDELYVDIYKKLEKRAVAGNAAPPPAPPPPPSEPPPPPADAPPAETPPPPQ
jgi:hypothetical protein